MNRYPVYVADIAPLGFDFLEIDGEITDVAVAYVRRLLKDSEHRREMVEHNFTLGGHHFSYAAPEARLREVLATLT